MDKDALLTEVHRTLRAAMLVLDANKGSEIPELSPELSTLTKWIAIQKLAQQARADGFEEWERVRLRTGMVWARGGSPLPVEMLDRLLEDASLGEAFNETRLLSDHSLGHAIRHAEATLNRVRRDIGGRLAPPTREDEQREQVAFDRLQEVRAERTRRAEVKLQQAAEVAARRQRTADSVAEREREVLRRREAAAFEDIAFWSRRFYTTLGIANAAAFAAVASGFLQAETADRIPVVTPVSLALTFYMWGMVAAGVIPMLNWWRMILDLRALSGQGRFRAAERLLKFLLAVAVPAVTLVSAVALIYGLGATIGGVRGLVAH